MKRTAAALALIMALSFSAISGVVLVNVAKASLYLPTITIRSDGSIEPETDFIEQSGNVYSLTADISRQYAIEIQCSNIVFDGRGHVINGSFEPRDYPYGYFNFGISLKNVNNVTVKNVQVTGFANREIELEESTECSILRVKADFFELYRPNCDSNMVVESDIDNLIIWSSNNTFARNNITSMLGVLDGSSNIFVENNFMCEFTRFRFGVGDFWDNGSVGNYWSDYLTRYPNASEIGSTGIGSTSYVIDANNVDRYPLMSPVDNAAPSINVHSPENRTYDTSSIQIDFTVNEHASRITYSLDGKENITIAGNETLAGLANGYHDLTIYATDEAGNVGTSETIRFAVDVPFPTTLVIAASGASLAVIGIGLLVYFKKRKR